VAASARRLLFIVSRVMLMSTTIASVHILSGYSLQESQGAGNSINRCHPATTWAKGINTALRDDTSDAPAICLAGHWHIAASFRGFYARLFLPFFPGHSGVNLVNNSAVTLLVSAAPITINSLAIASHFVSLAARDVFHNRRAKDSGPLGRFVGSEAVCKHGRFSHI
jgi:hypothetical protein